MGKPDELLVSPLNEVRKIARLPGHTVNRSPSTGCKLEPARWVGPQPTGHTLCIGYTPGEGVVRGGLKLWVCKDEKSRGQKSD